VGLWLAERGEGRRINRGGEERRVVRLHDRIQQEGEGQTYTSHCFDEPERYHDEGTLASADACTTVVLVLGLGEGNVRGK
jgi:hypothetical protein